MTTDNTKTLETLAAGLEQIAAGLSAMAAGVRTLAGAIPAAGTLAAALADMPAGAMAGNQAAAAEKAETGRPEAETGAAGDNPVVAGGYPVAPNLQEQTELREKTQVDSVPAAADKPASSPAASEQEPDKHSYSAPTDADRDALRNRVATLLSRGAQYSSQLRAKIRAGELKKASDVKTWDEYESLDFWLLSQEA